MSDSQTLPPTRNRLCPVCQSDNQTVRPMDGVPAPWNLKTCASCGCCYLENAPEYEDLEETFAWEKTSVVEENRRRHRRPWAKAISTGWKLFRQRVLKRDKLIDLVRGYIPRGRVLDIGCGTGSTLSRLPDSGHVPFGIEISRQLASEANQLAEPRGGRVVQASALDGAKQFPPDYFDGVLMSAFLEHEINPGPLLQALHRILKPGGHIIIKVPNHASLNRHFRGLQWCGYRFPDHVNYFTPTTLTRLATDSGYAIARFRMQDHLPTSDNLWMVLRKPT